MNEKIKKIALIAGFALFAYLSADLTATSFWLRFMNDKPFVVAFVVAFAISIIAGVMLTGAKMQLKNQINPSRTKFIGFVLGFLIFWGISFVTNVHANFLKQYGYHTLDNEITHCVAYLNEKTNVSDLEYDAERDSRIRKLQDKIDNLKEGFNHELDNTVGAEKGFGPKCISWLTQIESELRSDKEELGETYEYTIYREHEDAGYYGQSTPTMITSIRRDYSERIQNAIDRKIKVIDDYYGNKKDAGRIDNFNRLNMAKAIQGDLHEIPTNKRNFKGLYDFYNNGMESFITEMEKDNDYKQTVYITKTNKKGKEVVDGYKVYPSIRAFSFTSVWGDALSGKLDEDVSFVGGMPLALIWDVAAFVLIGML